MATKKSSNIPAEALALYDALIATVPGLERKGETVPYTSLNGHMTSYLQKDGTLSLRLPKAVLEEFLKKYNTKNTEAYGIIQKEYADVPATLFENTEELAEYFKTGYAYVAGLKPKATKKK